MSAPPPRAPPAGAAPNGPQPPKKIIRKKPNADPLVARKKTLPKPPMARRPADWEARSRASETAGQNRSLRQLEVKAMDHKRKRSMNPGKWSEQPQGYVEEFPLVTTKKQLMELRFHIMQLNTKHGNLDVTDQDQFPRPVTLQRRDPRLPPAHRMALKEEMEDVPMDDAEAERIRQEKEAKEAQRALDQAKIAPVMKPNEPNKPQKKDKTQKTHAFHGRHSEEHKKALDLKYQETLPWHLEDAEGKSGVWVGHYVAGLSEVNCALVQTKENKFQMIPLTRWYAFHEKPKFNVLSLDDAENMMKQNKDVKRWVMRDRERELTQKEKADTRMFLGGRARVKTESYTSRAAPKSERRDDYELDMSGDEFQDDDETPGFEAEDEDAKEAKERIRREQAAANLFGEGDQSAVDQEERERELERLRLKKTGKEVVKRLVKLEHAMDYDAGTDSDRESDNPFAESEESEDENEEKKEGEENKEEEKKDAPSGTNTKGTATPTGKLKAPDSTKKNKLKRAGSPNLSESSEAESNRKKVKLAANKGTTSLGQSRSNTPLPGRPKGATSDGEMSDGGAKSNRPPMKQTTLGGVVPNSRPGSPPHPGSPSGSPPPTSGSSTPANDFIKPEEVMAAIDQHPNGVALAVLMKPFSHRIDATPNRSKPHLSTKSEWLGLVKRFGYLGPDKLIRRKTGAAQGGGSGAASPQS
ncbi:Rap30/74 interaction domain-containing protein [Sordaria brevicollis]|uniref:Rap30/74 interaction domain-containing protein n=1 Tax=Sordaria brevicollis TaxID=83679 RepID=A0AAE0PET4_SORBR|nr:Rap30/74 interaction domain-containing protein [Sordaria brevicollis]